MRKNSGETLLFKASKQTKHVLSTQKNIILGVIVYKVEVFFVCSPFGSISWKCERAYVASFVFAPHIRRNMAPVKVTFNIKAIRLVICWFWNAIRWIRLIFSVWNTCTQQHIYTFQWRYFFIYVTFQTILLFVVMFSCLIYEISNQSHLIYVICWSIFGSHISTVENHKSQEPNIVYSWKRISLFIRCFGLYLWY